MKKENGSTMNDENISNPSHVIICKKKGTQKK